METNFASKNCSWFNIVFSYLPAILATMQKASRVEWTRVHLLIALNLYCKLPFGKLDHKNPQIVDAAKKMGRSAGSLAMKLCNFASLDPVLRARNIKGLPGVSRQDRAMWTEFHDNLTRFGEESEQLLHDLFTKDETKEIDFLHRDKVRLATSSNISIGATEAKATVKIRRGQQFFRQSILTAYGVSCCVSAINVPQLLIASHIKPWGQFPEQRLDPRNGLCLSSLHDAAFDAGLISFDTKLSLMLGKQLRNYFPQSALEQCFVPFEGKPIQLPHKLAEPDRSFMEYHRDEIFDKANR